MYKGAGDGQGRMSSLSVARALEEKLNRNFVVMLILAASGAILSVAECNHLWANGGVSDAACELMKLLTSFLTLWLLVFMGVYYRRKFEQLKSTNSLLPQDTLLSSGLFISTHEWSMLPEALLCAVHAPPFVCAEMTIPYYDVKRGMALSTTINTDELAAMTLLFARSVLLVRWTPYLAGLTAKHARAYANMNHLTLSTWLAVRLTCLRYPARMLSVSTLLCINILAFAMQASEHRVNHGLDHYPNAVWLTVVSMTGIGFGDLYPMTPIGRAISGVAFAWGAFVAAVVVMTILRTFELSDAENRVNNLVSTSEAKLKLRQKAAIYVQAAWAAYLERLHRSQSSMATLSLLGNEPLHADPKFCRSMRAFRELRKRLTHTDDEVHLIFKEMLDTRTRLELHLHQLEERLVEMDAKFEHNIAAMNELLQKNLKYLKHLA